MSLTQDQTTTRRVRLQTSRGCTEGVLRTSAVVRTLDDINMVARGYITLHEPRALSGSWDLDAMSLALAKTAVLFVQELDDPPPRPNRGAEGGRFSRSPVRLWVGDYSIQGFVHVPRGGTAMARLNQSGHAFIALTSVSVVGPGAEFATPFLAVNRDRILAAQEIPREEPDPDEETASEPAGAVTFEEIDDPA